MSVKVFAGHAANVCQVAGSLLLVVSIGAMAGIGLRQYVDSRPPSAPHSIRHAPEGCMFDRVYCPRDGGFTDCARGQALTCLHCGWSR